MLILEAQKILTHTHISFFKPCAETKSRKLHLVQFLPLDICGFVWIRGQDFLLLATGAFLVPDHLYIYGFTLTWIQWMPSGMDMSRKKKGALSLQLSHRPCVFRCHECIAASLSGAGWWLCDGSQLCFVGAPYLEEPPNHHEADLMTGL